MTKKLIAVLLALAVVLTTCVCVFAATPDGSSDVPPASGASSGTADGDTPPVTDVPVVPVLKLDKNGGEGSMEDIAIGDNGKVVVPECTFTKEFYTFTGWNVFADGSSTQYQAGDEIALDADLILYAQWQHNNAQVTELSVTYDANGGEGSVVDSTIYLVDNDVFVAYNEFTREGYEFLHWNTKADGSGHSYEEEEVFTITENVTLYAIWKNINPTPPTPSTPSEVVSKIESETKSKIESTPKVKEPVEEVEDDVTTTNPKTGDTVATTVALGAAVIALGAFVVLKKKD